MAVHTSTVMENETMDLIQEAIKGSSVAWNGLVKRYQRKVFAVALSVMRDMDDADEVTQEVFVRLYTNLKNIKDPGVVGSWLTKTAYNISCDKLRYKRIRGWFSPFSKSDYEILDTKSLSEDVQRAELSDKIQSWINAKLTKMERAVLQLRVGEEMSFSEVASALELSTSSVKTYYYRALEKMKSLYHEGGIS